MNRLGTKTGYVKNVTVHFVFCFFLQIMDVNLQSGSDKDNESVIEVPWMMKAEVHGREEGIISFLKLIFYLFTPTGFLLVSSYSLVKKWDGKMGTKIRLSLPFFSKSA